MRVRPVAVTSGGAGRECAACPPGRFESYEEDAEGVTVHFQGGAPGPVRARVLIGADGYFSAVRQQCLADGPPDFGVRPVPSPPCLA